MAPAPPLPPSPLPPRPDLVNPPTVRKHPPPQHPPPPPPPRPKICKPGRLPPTPRHSNTAPRRITAFQAAGVRHSTPAIVAPASPAACPILPQRHPRGGTKAPT